MFQHFLFGIRINKYIGIGSSSKTNIVGPVKQCQQFSDTLVNCGNIVCLGVNRSIICFVINQQHWQIDFLGNRVNIIESEPMLQLFQNALILFQNKYNRGTDIGQLANHLFGGSRIEITRSGGDCPTAGGCINSTNPNLDTALFQSKRIAVQADKAFVNTLLGLSAQFLNCTGKENDDAVMCISRLVDQSNIG